MAQWILSRKAPDDDPPQIPRPFPPRYPRQPDRADRGDRRILARRRGARSRGRGAILGVGAHAVGTAKANEIGRAEGSIAGLMMVLVGVFNVLVAPLIAECLRHL
jgi:LrgB-like family